MGYIYKIWNDNNEKVYIGQTTIGIKTRWSQHLYHYLIDNTILYRAMRKYGAGSFHIDIIEECENEKLNDREIYWIAYYDSYNNGYNSTPGGTSLASGNMPKQLDKKWIYNLWDQGKSITEIKEITGYSNTSIKDYLTEYQNYSIQESIIRGNNKSGKSRRIAVSQWDLSGNFIATYDSIAIAAKQNNISIQNISACLKKKRQTANNYYWTYENELPTITKTQIYQYDLQGNLIKIYNTKAEAANELHIDSGSITKVCKGQRKTCGGYVWKEISLTNK